MESNLTEESNLRVRLAYLLIGAGYTTLDKVKKATDRELLAIPGIGHQSIREIRDLIGGPV